MGRLGSQWALRMFPGGETAAAAPPAGGLPGRRVSQPGRRCRAGSFSSQVMLRRGPPTPGAGRGPCSCPACWQERWRNWSGRRGGAAAAALRAGEERNGTHTPPPSAGPLPLPGQKGSGEWGRAAAKLPARLVRPPAPQPRPYPAGAAFLRRAPSPGQAPAGRSGRPASLRGSAGGRWCQAPRGARSLRWDAGRRSRDSIPRGGSVRSAGPGRGVLGVAFP